MRLLTQLHDFRPRPRAGGALRHFYKRSETPDSAVIPAPLRRRIVHVREVLTTTAVVWLARCPIRPRCRRPVDPYPLVFLCCICETNPGATTIAAYTPNWRKLLHKPGLFHFAADSSQMTTVCHRLCLTRGPRARPVRQPHHLPRDRVVLPHHLLRPRARRHRRRSAQHQANCAEERSTRDTGVARLEVGGELHGGTRPVARPQRSGRGLSRWSGGGERGLERKQPAPLEEGQRSGRE